MPPGNSPRRLAGTFAGACRSRWSAPWPRRRPGPRQARRPTATSRPGWPSWRSPRSARRRPREQARALSLAAEGPGSLLRDGNRVLVEVRFDHGAAAGVDDLRAAGAKIVDVSPRYQTVTVAAKPDELRTLSDVPRVAAATEVLTPFASASTCPSGAVVSEGDAQLHAEEARETALGTRRQRRHRRDPLRLLQPGNGSRRRQRRQSRPASRRRRKRRPARLRQHLRRRADAGRNPRRLRKRRRGRGARDGPDRPRPRAGRRRSPSRPRSPAKPHSPETSKRWPNPGGRRRRRKGDRRRRHLPRRAVLPGRAGRRRRQAKRPKRASSYFSSAGNNNLLDPVGNEIGSWEAANTAIRAAARRAVRRFARLNANALHGLQPRRGNRQDLGNQSRPRAAR